MTRRLVVALGVVSVLAPSSAFAGLAIRVLGDVVVMRDVVTIGDIAVIEGDEAHAARIRGLRFSPAPPAAGRHRFDAPAIRARLRQAGVDIPRIALDVPDVLVVTRAFQTIPGDALVDAVRREARVQLPDPGDDLALVPINRVDDRRTPTGAVALVARLQNVRSDAPFIAATVTVSIDGRDHETVPLTFRVGRYQRVIVATRALEPRTVPGAADFRSERRLSTETPPDALTEVQGAGDVEVTQALKPGDVVTARALRPRILVKRGELVTLLLEGRGVRITAQGEAGEDARRGDTVRVVNPTSRREILGKVDGPGLVRVPFADAGSER
jgi:flagella basal body P-ring formation protein FlgA